MSRRFEIFKALIADWSAGDIDAVLERMTDDIVWHFATGVAPPARGKAKARKFMENLKTRMSQVNWRLFDYAERGDTLFVEGVDEYLSSEGHWVASPYAGVLEFRGDLLCGWRDYVDVGVMDAQRRGEGRSAWVVALMGRTAL